MPCDPNCKICTVTQWHNEGVKLLEKAKETNSETFFFQARDCFLLALKYYPEELSYLDYLGRVLIALGEVTEDSIAYQQEINTYQQALSHIPADTTASTKATYLNRLGIAFHCLANLTKQPQDYHHAIDQYDAALKLAPDEPVYLNNMGLALAELGEITQDPEVYQQKIKIYQHALRSTPTHAETDATQAKLLNWLGMAFSYLAKLTKQPQDYHHAIDQYDAAFKLNLDEQDYLNNMGEALAELGQITQAPKIYQQKIKMYQHALRSVPTHAKTDLTHADHLNWLGMAFSYLAKLTKQPQDYHHAIDHYGAALKLAPNNLAYLNNMGLALAELGEIIEDPIAYQQEIKAYQQEIKAYQQEIKAYQQALDDVLTNVQKATVKAKYLNWLGDAFYHLANLTKQPQDYQNAIDQYYAALRLVPYNLLYLNNIGIALSKLGEITQNSSAYQQEIQAYQQALHNAPTNVQTATNKADRLNWLGVAFHCLAKLTKQPQDYHHAIDQYDAALKLAPNNLAYLNNMGLALTELGQITQDPEAYRQKIKVYQHTLRRVPTHAKTDLTHADHLNWLGMAFSYLAKLTKQPQDYHHAINQYDAALKLAPNNLAYLNNMGNALIELGEITQDPEAYRQKIKMYQHALRSVPTHAETDSVQAGCLSLLGLAFSYLAKLTKQPQDYQNAIDQYNAAFKLAPDELAFLNAMGAMLTELGQITQDSEAYQQKIKVYQHALRRVPTHAKTDLTHADHLNWLGMAFSYLAKLTKQPQDYHHAINQYDAALKLAPNNLAYLNNMGNALIELGQITQDSEAYRQKIKMYQHALRSVPTHAETDSVQAGCLSLLGLAFSYLAKLTKQPQDYQNAIDQYNAAFKLAPDELAFLNAMGAMLTELGQITQDSEAYQQKIKVYQHALRSAPTHAKTDATQANRLNRLGLAFHYLANLTKQPQDYHHAIDQYDAALKLAPDELVYLNNMGNALIELGEITQDPTTFQQAIENFLTAFKLDPTEQNHLDKLEFAFAKLKKTANNLAAYQKILTIFVTQYDIDKFPEKLFQIAEQMLNEFVKHSSAQEARNHLDQWIKQAAHVPYLWWGKAHMYMKTNKHLEAFICLEQAIALAPNNIGYSKKRSEILKYIFDVWYLPPSGHNDQLLQKTTPQGKNVLHLAAESKAALALQTVADQTIDDFVLIQALAKQDIHGDTPLHLIEWYLPEEDSIVLNFHDRLGHNMANLDQIINHKRQRPNQVRNKNTHNRIDTLEHENHHSTECDQQALNQALQSIQPTLWPSDYEYALLADHAYKNLTRGQFVQFPAETNNSLMDWRVLAIHQNQKSGYYGVEFVSISRGVLALVHRGSEVNVYDILLYQKDIKADIEGIVHSKLTPQARDARSATKKAIENSRRYCLMFSTAGHSLGAWLADISVYTAHIEHKQLYTHAVLFDSPGFEGIRKTLIPRLDKLEKDAERFFDIKSYLAPPNPVNTMHTHRAIGHHIQRIFPEREPTARQYSWNVYLIRELLNYHQLKYFIQALAPNFTGRPAEQIKDWPVVEFKYWQALVPQSPAKWLFKQLITQYASKQLQQTLTGTGLIPIAEYMLDTFVSIPFIVALPFFASMRYSHALGRFATLPNLLGMYILCAAVKPYTPPFNVAFTYLNSLIFQKKATSEYSKFLNCVYESTDFDPYKNGGSCSAEQWPSIRYQTAPANQRRWYLNVEMNEIWRGILAKHRETIEHSTDDLLLCEELLRKYLKKRYDYIDLHAIEAKSPEELFERVIKLIQRTARQSDQKTCMRLLYSTQGVANHRQENLQFIPSSAQCQHNRQTLVTLLQTTPQASSAGRATPFWHYPLAWLNRWWHENLLFGSKTSTPSIPQNTITVYQQPYDKPYRQHSSIPLHCVSTTLDDVNALRCLSEQATVFIFQQGMSSVSTTHTSSPEQAGDFFRTSDCRPITFYGNDSAVCKGETTTAVYVPTHIEHPIKQWFDGLSAQVALMATLLHLGKKMKTAFQNVSERSTNQEIVDNSDDGQDRFIDDYTDHDHIASLEQLFFEIQQKISIDDYKYRWFKFGYEDCQERFTEIKQLHKGKSPKLKTLFLDVIQLKKDLFFEQTISGMNSLTNDWLNEQPANIDDTGITPISSTTRHSMFVQRARTQNIQTEVTIPPLLLDHRFR